MKGEKTMLRNISINLDAQIIVAEGDQLIGNEDSCADGSIILNFEELQQILLAIGCKTVMRNCDVP